MRRRHRRPRIWSLVGFGSFCKILAGECLNVGRCSHWPVWFLVGSWQFLTVLGGSWQILGRFVWQILRCVWRSWRIPELNARSGVRSHWKSFKIRPWRKRFTNHPKWHLMAFRECLGQRSVSGAQRSERGNLEMEPSRRHLVDFGHNLGSHWILKGSPNRPSL